jgi:hypothetical protein
MPAIAYILDMNVRTDGNYGLNEALLASAVVSPLSLLPKMFCKISNPRGNISQNAIQTGGFDIFDYRSTTSDHSRSHWAD